MDKPPLVVIAGATASGKSAAALDLAERRGGVVINADASQVYADLRLLSARPSPAEEARVPHLLYGVVDGSVACSAVSWAAMARAAIAEVQGAGQLPILVGGTGLYIRTLLDGIAPVPEIPEDVRAEVRALDDPHTALATEDPAMAARLRPSDRQRSARALEVWRATRRSLGEWQQANVGGIAPHVTLEPYVVEIGRDALYRRCELRFDTMLAAGALEEVAALAARDLAADLPVMKALGVPPLLRHLRGEIGLHEAAEIAKRDTRHYAKRQLTWFRHQAATWTRLGESGVVA